MKLPLETTHSKGFLYHWTDKAPSWALAHFEKDLRARQHASSRMAISLLLQKDFNIDLPPEEIEIVDHQFIKGFPELKVSLSHTKDAWALATISNHQDVLGLGVDLEFTDREIKKGIEKLYINEEDFWQEEPLQLWCFKEAAFKAISPLLESDVLNKTFVLKDIIVEGDEFLLKGMDQVLGNFEQYQIKVEEQEFLITEAYLKRLPQKVMS